MITSKDRVLGCLYGMSIGDAMGTPSSFQTPEQIKQKWEWIDKFICPEENHIFHGGLKAGEYTDDTEQSLALLDSYIENKKVIPQDVVTQIIKWADRVKNKYVSPLGPSTEKALKAIRSGQCSIETSGRFSLTNGSCMRIAPIGIIHGLLNTSLEELLDDVYQTSFPTHNTTICMSAASAIAYGVSLCIRGVENISEIVDGIIQAAEAGSKMGFPVVGPSISKRIKLIEGIISNSNNEIEAMTEMWNLFGGGDLAGDSVPVTVGLFILGNGNPYKTIQYAVNFGGDCDTNACMAGALSGAFSGPSEIPVNLREEIETINNVDFEKYTNEVLELVKFWNK